MFFFTATSLSFLATIMGLKEHQIFHLVLLATIVYGFIGIRFPSNLVWMLSLMSLATWFGYITGYLSNWSQYFFGLNYPFRYVFFGLMLIAVRFTIFQKDAFKEIRKSTYVFELLFVFLGLWTLSINGNHTDMDLWMKTKQVYLLGWAIFFGVSALITLLIGIKYDDSIARAFGIVFFFINLYTRLVEYVWGKIPEAIFYLILALTFWLIGKNAEKFGI
ncbi:MAG: hypothetical protein GX116_00505 [Fibrobacter sp.]|nr:hypothetical protein [Fibrobacter sp.]